MAVIRSTLGMVVTVQGRGKLYVGRRMMMVFSNMGREAEEQQPLPYPGPKCGESGDP